MKLITLQTSGDTPTTPAPQVPCSVSTHEAYFQIRVLDTDCLIWSDDLKQHIATSFMDELMNVITAECRDCMIPPNAVEITEGPTCSNQLSRGAVFRGMITTDTVTQTEDAFCALSLWQQNGPLVVINNHFLLVDRGCSIGLESPTGTECLAPPITTSSKTLPIIIGAAAGGVLLLVSSLIFLVCCCVWGSRHRTRDMKLNQRNCQNYER